MATASPARTQPQATPHRISPPVYRFLKVFAFDPNFGHNYGNFMEMNVPYEELKVGPLGEYLSVIDYDTVNKCYYEPVNLDDPLILGNHGLDPSESDPRFHQQMVYAVASETITRFREALGHPIHWRLEPGAKTIPSSASLSNLATPLSCTDRCAR